MDKSPCNAVLQMYGLNSSWTRSDMVLHYDDMELHYDDMYAQIAEIMKSET